MSELARTLRAAVAAALLAFLLIAGMAWFLGIPTGTSLTSGVVAALLALALVLGAARRSGHLDHDEPPPPG
jgi:phosphate/sulfate permease